MELVWAALFSGKGSPRFDVSCVSYVAVVVFVDERLKLALESGAIWCEGVILPRGVEAKRVIALALRSWLESRLGSCSR